MAEGLVTDGWKTNIEHWLKGAKELSDSMYKNGFLAQHALPIDSNGELLNGSHRLACAIAYNLPDVYTWEVEKEAWAPPWDYDWFIANKCPEVDLKRIVSDWENLRATKGNT